MEPKERSHSKNPQFDRHTTRTLGDVYEVPPRPSHQQCTYNHIKPSRAQQSHRHIKARVGDRTSLMVRKKGVDLIKYINLKDDLFKKSEAEPQKLESFQEKCYQKYNIGARKNVTFALALA